MNITAKLNDWEKHQLLTTAQKEKILAYENQVRRPLFFYSLIFLSCFCIGLGAIALIASNWEQIPPSFKLSLDFMFLLANAGALWWSFSHNRRLAAEGLLILFAILILASIGLIAQVYHLPPRGLLFLTFWCVMTFPLLFLSGRVFFPFMWLMAFYAAWFDYLYHVHSRFVQHLRDVYPLWLDWMMPLLLLLVYQGLKRTSLTAVAKAAKLWIVILAGGLALVLDFRFFYSCYSWPDQGVYGYGLWLAGAVILGIFGWFNRNTPLKYGALSLGILLLYILQFSYLPADETGQDLLGALLTIGLLFVCSVYAYRYNHPRLLNTASILIALRFFIIYLQVFGSLLTTGFGLIASGVVFLVLAVAWRRVRRRLNTDLKEKNNA